MAGVAEKHLVLGALVEDKIGAVCVDGFDFDFFAVGDDDIAGLYGLDRCGVKTFRDIQGQLHFVAFLVFDIRSYHPPFQVGGVDFDGFGLNGFRGGGADQYKRQNKGQGDRNQFFHFGFLLHN